MESNSAPVVQKAEPRETRPHGFLQRAKRIWRRRNRHVVRDGYSVARHPDLYSARAITGDVLA